jgi:glycosyltransferase involved in cell wall biosynthesis
MIYLDVTSACHSPLNTGVKRMQRGLHHWLRQRDDYAPVCWQSAWQAYRTLRRCDYLNLEQDKRPRGLQLFDFFAPGMVSDWVHSVNDGFRLINFFQDARPVDMLLLPDLLWDNRAPVIERLWETGIHRVAIFHDAIALRRPNQSRIDRFFCGRGVRALSEVDAVVCISQEAEDDLLYFWKRFGLQPTSTFVVPWPVPFAHPRPQIFPNFAARQLLYVARIEPHKNHLRLLAACEKLWREGLNFSLRLIGCKAYPFYAARVGAQILALRGKGRPIRWDTHVSEDELHAAYRDSSFTVFPSLLEGFGLPIIESLWHGRPVVCGANGALGEIAAAGGCAAVDTESVDSIAAEIRRMLTDQAHYEILHLQAHFRRYRDWAAYWQELERAVK